MDFRFPRFISGLGTQTCLIKRPTNNKKIGLLGLCWGSFHLLFINLLEASGSWKKCQPLGRKLTVTVRVFILFNSTAPYVARPFARVFTATWAGLHWYVPDRPLYRESLYRISQPGSTSIWQIPDTRYVWYYTTLWCQKRLFAMHWPQHIAVTNSVQHNTSQGTSWTWHNTSG